MADGGDCQDVLARLKFIAKIRPQTKIEVCSLALRDTSLSNRAYRHFMTPLESKETTYEFLNTTFNHAFELVARTGSGGFEQQMRQLLLTAIHDALAGMQNLNKTYEHSDIFVSRLQALTEVMDSKLSELQRADPGASRHPA